jgi:hypothetical protein
MPTVPVSREARMRRTISGSTQGVLSSTDGVRYGDHADRSSRDFTEKAVEAT